MNRSITARLPYDERLALDQLANVTGQPMADIIREGLSLEMVNTMRNHVRWPLACVTNTSSRRHTLNTFWRWSFVITSEDPAAYLEVSSDDPERYDFRPQAVNPADIDSYVKEYEELFIR